MKQLVWVLIAISIPVGCGTTTGNYATTLVIQGSRPASSSVMKTAWGNAVSSTTSITVKKKNGSTAGTLTLSDVRIAIKEIKIKTSTSQEDAEIKFRGPYLVNFLTDVVTPSFSSIVLPTARYKGFRLKLDKIEGDEKDGSGNQLVASSDSLFGKSIYMAGTYTGSVNGGSVSGATFTLSFKDDEEFNIDRTSGDAGVSVDASASQTIILAFQLANWFDFSDTTINENNVDLSEVTTSGGRIDLNDDSSGTNEKIWQVIRKGLKNTAKFGKDKDGNNRLDDNEKSD